MPVFICLMASEWYDEWLMNVIYNFTWLMPIVNGNKQFYSNFFFPHFYLLYVNFGSYTKYLISFFCSKAGSMEAWIGCAKSGWRRCPRYRSSERAGYREPCWSAPMFESLKRDLLRWLRLPDLMPSFVSQLSLLGDCLCLLIVFLL